MIRREPRAVRSFVVALATMAAAGALGSCGPSAPRTRPITLTFRGEVGGMEFACGRDYAGVGASATTFTAEDFRFYVHDLRVVGADGVQTPIALDDDGQWQDGDVALLDFEDGGSACGSGGNTPTNHVVRGTLPADLGPITGVRFVVGVPPERNHLDSATQPSPLNLTTMFWSWMDGYKFVRIEGRTTGQPGGIAFHLGATGCTGDARMGTRVCANTNLPEIALDVASEEALGAGAIVADLADLFATTDLDVDAGGLAGCQSSESDPECATIFAELGLRGGTQRFFHFEGAP